MSAAPPVSAATVERLVELACSWTGFSRSAVQVPAIRRIVAARIEAGCSEEELLRQATAHHPEVVRAFLQVVSVGETYFFRHPEHFELLAATLQDRCPTRPVLRAWSAGCATGEEAYSLAACLLAHAPAGVEVEVVGTDLLERNLEVARAGCYGPWSVRDSGPILYPVFTRKDARDVEVLERVRAAVRFERHNLLDGPPGVPGSFDLVCCRNVLIYFSPESAQAVSNAVAAALVPGGLAVFGPMDLFTPPPGLVRLDHQLTVFRRIPEGLPQPPPPPPPPRAAALTVPRPCSRPRPAPVPVPVPRAAPAPAPAPAVEPVTVHLRALVELERGELGLAKALLDRLSASVPGYLPGLLERALLSRRLGDAAAAAELMRQLLQATASLPGDQLISGHEELPVSYYRTTAELFLHGQQRERG